jgi:ATP-dependent Lon protease
MAEAEFQSLQDARVPSEVPGLALASTVVFPYDVVSVQVNRPKSLRLIRDNPGDDVIVACFFPRDAGHEDTEGDPADVSPVGVACRVIHRMQMPNETLQVVFQGLRRVRLVEALRTEPYFRYRIEPVEPKEPRGPEIDGLVYRSMEMVDELVRAEGKYPQEMVNVLRMNIAGGGRFADLVGAHVNLPLAVKRKVASTADVRDRLRIIEEVLQEAIVRVRLESEMSQKVQVEIGQRQRESVLRAQMRAIRRELGEEASAEKEVEDLRERLRAAGLPKEAEQVATREIDRLAGMTPASSEHHVLRAYVGWILDLPWSVLGAKRVDLGRAKRILDRDHFGLEDVKERILEFLAVRRLRKDPRGPILCLVGPPGVGKTSLGRSVAEATGRAFVRVSVGGMRDEAEIKGHRRTYVGALPGKILQTLKRAGTRDPLFMIDEIDKMGSDPGRGDPSSAMLEVLDPEQNAAFLDHYLDIPFDLSRVFFVATGNVLDEVPGPLRDRMEVVTLSGYTREEKFHIARRHLIPRVLEGSGLDASHIEVTDEGLRAVIDGHTREAGVRSLERLLARVARKVAYRVAAEKAPRTVVGAAEVERLLGPPVFEDETRAREPAVGVSTGLAWTAGGGSLLFVEATSMAGTGHIHITGRLGEVMRESVEIAMSWVRSHAGDLGVEDGAFARRDVHVHAPEGAVPKDGPSAGVTLVTALASLFTGKPVRTDLAMTGEVTLKGRVLPVGGIKEKVLAAHRAGLRRVLLPEGNRKDLRDVPEEVLAEMEVEFAGDVARVLDSALLAVILPDVSVRASRRGALRPEAPPPPA